LPGSGGKKIPNAPTSDLFSTFFCLSVCLSVRFVAWHPLSSKSVALFAAKHSFVKFFSKKEDFRCDDLFAQKLRKWRSEGSMLRSQFSAFLPIFCENVGVLLKNQCYDPNFTRLCSVLNKNANFLPKKNQNRSLQLTKNAFISIWSRLQQSSELRQSLQ
jgi:hypothetical protein